MEQEECMEVVDGLLAPWHEGWHFAYDRYLSYPPCFQPTTTTLPPLESSAAICGRGS